jgi:hypothetical protein
MGGGNFRITSQYDEYEMGRRLACEKELESLPEVLNICRPSFDETGNFLVSHLLDIIYLILKSYNILLHSPLLT